MFANPKWFKRRKYTGWGLSPNTWQGWLYVGIWLLILVVTTFILKNIHLNNFLAIGIITTFSTSLVVSFKLHWLVDALYVNI